MYGGCLLRILFHFLTKNVMKSAMRVCKTLLWRKERFRGQHILGFAVEDGITNGLGFTGLFIRLRRIHLPDPRHEHSKTVTNIRCPLMLPAAIPCEHMCRSVP